MSDAFAREGAKHGIRVNAIAPVASTGALAQAWEKTSDMKNATVFKPEYNVPMVLLLCSDTILANANGVTGSLFEIGCGWHARTRLRASEGYSIVDHTTPSPEDIRKQLAVITPSSEHPSDREFAAIDTEVLANIERRKTAEIGRKEYRYGELDVVLYSTHPLYFTKVWEMLTTVA